ncbi:MAG: hypothetical protein R3349_02965, partial [Geminicoccaceae bacterium]|nr:hypothetical protein [Geminicoccaceae bacterium]
ARRPFARSFRLVCFGAGGLAMVGMLGLSIVEQTMTTKARFATVTAPMIELRAPSSGQVAPHDLEEGDYVVRDQRLADVADNDLRAELALARATFDYTEQLIFNLEDHLRETGGSGSGAAGADVRVRLNELRSTRDLESARIAALEVQSQSNAIHAPCDCLVWWARGSAGREWVRKGERILTLVQPDPAALMVEALVHLSEVDGLAPGQQALVELPSRGEPIVARIETIVLESERQPRAGFPDWLRQDRSLASVLLRAERPLSAELVGMPVRVTFTGGLESAWLAASFDDGTAEAWWSAETGTMTPGAARSKPAQADASDLVMSIPATAAARKVWADDQR